MRFVALDQNVLPMVDKPVDTRGAVKMENIVLFYTIVVQVVKNGQMFLENVVQQVIFLQENVAQTLLV